MTGRDPLEGISPERLAWHQGALDGDPVVCAAQQPGQPDYPCVWNRSAHLQHRDVFGRTWSALPEEPLRVARKAPVVDGMVTVETGDHGPVRVAEPSWCTGIHEAEAYREDIEHQGVEHVAEVETPCHGPVPVLSVSLAQRPFSAIDGRVHALLQVDEELHELNAAGLDEAAGLLVEHASTLRKLARELSVLEASRGV